jgi:hypothetical protein
MDPSSKVVKSKKKLRVTGYGLEAEAKTPLHSSIN